jgi:hypothetical protein
MKVSHVSPRVINSTHLMGWACSSMYAADLLLHNKNAQRTLHDFDCCTSGLIACQCSGIVACAFKQVAQLLRWRQLQQ